MFSHFLKCKYFIFPIFILILQFYFLNLGFISNIILFSDFLNCKYFIFQIFLILILPFCFLNLGFIDCNIIKHFIFQIFLILILQFCFLNLYFILQDLNLVKFTFNSWLFLMFTKAQVLMICSPPQTFYLIFQIILYFRYIIIFILIHTFLNPVFLIKVHCLIFNFVILIHQYIYHNLFFPSTN